MKWILLNTFLLISLSAWSAQDPCPDKDIYNVENIKSLSHFLTDNSSKNKILAEDQINKDEIIKTQKDEFIKITFKKPYNVEFLVYPETEIQVLNKGLLGCGPQIKLNSGKILSTGNHPLRKNSDLDNLKKGQSVLPNNPVAEICPFEIETNEAYIQPVGTSYLAESGALNDAIAELNGESKNRNKNNLVGVGQTGVIEESSYEKYSVKKGIIKIKLKSISKNKLRNPIKYSKNNDRKNNKLANSEKKTTTRYVAFNQKIQLKAGASMTVKRKKSSPKTQTADLEVIDPSGY